jgi:hypothetical protein
MVNNWQGVILDIDEPTDEVLGLHGGNEINRFNKLFDGINLTSEDGSDVTINTDWYFFSNKLKFMDGDGHILNIIIPNLTGNRNLTFPDASGTVGLSSFGTQAVEWGENLQSFVSNYIKLLDADQTHGIKFKTQGMTANWDLTFPVPSHATNEEVVYTLKEQTLYNKILQSPTLSAFIFNVDQNTLKNSANNNNGDLYVYSSAAGKAVKMSIGSAGQVLTVNPLGDGILWATPGSISSTIVSGDYLVPKVNNIVTGSWYGTDAVNADGIWTNFLENVSNVTPYNLIDPTTNKIGMRYDFLDDDDRGGFRTKTKFFTLANAPELYVRYRWDLDAHDHEYRHAIGFVNQPEASDFGTDGAVNNRHAFMWYKEKAHLNVGVVRNDGDATQDFTTDANASLTALTESITTVRIIGDPVLTRWGISVNDNPFVYYNTEIPTTQRLGVLVRFENEDSDTRSVEIYGSYIKLKVL